MEEAFLCAVCKGSFHRGCVSNEEGSNEQYYCSTCINDPVDMWTCWIPLSDLSGAHSRLEVLPGSHKSLGEYEAPFRYTSPSSRGVRTDLLPGGYKEIDSNGGAWQTPKSIAMGDLIIFNLKTVHRANKHQAACFRLSIDTRVTTCSKPVQAAGTALEEAMQELRMLNSKC